MINTTETLATRLKTARKARGYSQDKLEELSGVNRNYIAKIECGNVANPAEKYIKDLARVVKVSAEFLTHGIINTDTIEFEDRRILMRLKRLPEHRRQKYRDAINALLDTA